MDAQTFLDNFATIADAPGGIARLRKLIRSLGLSGRLTEQRPDDQQLADPMKSAAEDLQVLRASQRVARHELGPPLSPALIPSLPLGWERMRLSQVAGRISGNSKLIKGKLYSEPSSGLFQGFSASGPDVWLDSWDFDGDAVVVSAVGARCGKAFRATYRWSAIANTTILWPFRSLIGIEYLLLLANDEDFWLRSGGAQPFVAFRDSLLQPIGLPPLAEQERIVAKVEELMGLCHDLEHHQGHRDRAMTRFRTSGLQSLSEAAMPDDLGCAWERMSNNWRVFTHDAESIEGLREIVPRLAVRGGLVHQVPNEGHADELLTATRQTRLAELSLRQLRIPKALPPMEAVAKPFDLPPGWAWARLTDLGELARGRSQHRPRNDPGLYAGGTMPLVQTGDVARADRVIESWTALYNDAGIAQSRVWPPGTLCITIAANIADSALLPFEACIPDSVVGFIPFSPLPDARYLDLFIRSVQGQLEAFAPSTAQKNINLATLDDLMVPLPPLAEMHRIVAAADWILGSCDRLTVELLGARATSEYFSASAIGSVTHPHRSIG